MWPRRHPPVVLAPLNPPPEPDPDEMVWQLAEKRAADLADARRALVEAETTIGQLEAYLGAVRQINVRLTAQAAHLRQQLGAAQAAYLQVSEERDDYQKRLKATDQAWTRVARQRDEMQEHLGHAVARIDRVRELHTDSPAGVCPSCGRIGEQSDTDDGLVAWPCATIVALDPTAREADAGGGQ